MLCLRWCGQHLHVLPRLAHQLQGGRSIGTCHGDQAQNAQTRVWQVPQMMSVFIDVLHQAVRVSCGTLWWEARWAENALAPADLGPEQLLEGLLQLPSLHPGVLAVNKGAHQQQHIRFLPLAVLQQSLQRPICQVLRGCEGPCGNFDGQAVGTCSTKERQSLCSAHFKRGRTGNGIPPNKPSLVKGCWQQ